MALSSSRINRLLKTWVQYTATIRKAQTPPCFLSSLHFHGVIQGSQLPRRAIVSPPSPICYKDKMRKALKSRVANSLPTRPVIRELWGSRCLSDCRTWVEQPHQWDLDIWKLSPNVQSPKGNPREKRTAETARS